MDYVVFGTGYGATLMLLGWILRTFGPDFRYRLADDDDPPGGDFLLGRISWRRFSEGIGALIATAGMAVVLVTFILILINPSASTGTWIALAMFALTLVAAAVWSWLYVGQYGTFGILPEPRQDDQAFRPEPAPGIGDAQPETDPFVGPVAPESVPTSAVPQDEMAYADDYDDAEPVEQFDEDEYAERRIRMSRYQSHVPDDRQADDTADEVDVEAGDESAEEDEPVIGDDESYDLIGEVDSEDDGPGVLGEPDASEDEAEQPEAFSDDDGEPDDEPAPDAAADDRDESGEDDPTPGDHLEDTPEGRAEALRRIQSWHPDDPGKA